MAAKLLKDEKGVKFWQDPLSGLVYANDKRYGKTWSCHPFHHLPRKNSRLNLIGWGWGDGDRLIALLGSVFNAEIFQTTHPIEKAIGQMCGCTGCIFRRDTVAKASSVRRLLQAVTFLHRGQLLDRHTGKFNTTGWDKRCNVCARAMKAAEKHGLTLPDPQTGDMEPEQE